MDSRRHALINYNHEDKQRNDPQNVKHTKLAIKSIRRQSDTANKQLTVFACNLLHTIIRHLYR